jgi:hypothetical protein
MQTNKERGYPDDNAAGEADRGVLHRRSVWHRPLIDQWRLRPCRGGRKDGPNRRQDDPPTLTAKQRVCEAASIGGAGLFPTAVA